MAASGLGHSICQVLSPTGGREMNRGCEVDGGTIEGGGVCDEGGDGDGQREVRDEGRRWSGAADSIIWGSGTSGCEVWPG